MNKRTKAIYDVGVKTLGRPDPMLAAIASMIDLATAPNKRKTPWGAPVEKPLVIAPGDLLTNLLVPTDGTPSAYARLTKVLQRLNPDPGDLDRLFDYVAERPYKFYQSKGLAWSIETVIKKLEQWLNESRAHKHSMHANTEEMVDKFR